MAEVLLLALLQLAGSGAVLAARVRPALACALGFPLGLALWLALAGLAASLGIPPSPVFTLGPALSAAGAALALGRRPGWLIGSALAVAGLAALAVWAGIALVPLAGHDALLAAQIAAPDWSQLDPSARTLALLHGGVRALGAPLAVAVGPLAAAATACLVAAGAWRRPAIAILVALALASLPPFIRQTFTIDVEMTAALFATAFAVAHARGAIDGNRRLLPLECLLLAGLAFQSPLFTWTAALLVPLAYRRDPRPPASVAAWLAVLAAAVLWWQLAALIAAPDRLDVAAAGLAPLAAAAIWLLSRRAPLWRAVTGTAILAALAAATCEPDPGALFLLLPLVALLLGSRAAGRRPRAPASAAAMPPWPRAAAGLFAGAMLVAALGNLAEHVHQHRTAAPGTRFSDPGPTTRVDRWTDLHAWIRQTTPGVTALIPARLASQVVLFRYFAGIEVEIADPPPAIPAAAALDLVFQADDFRTLHFKRTRTRETVVVFARPGARRYVLAGSMFGVLYWLPEEMYLEAGGRPPR